MYKVDTENKSLIKLSKATFSDLNLRERFDIQEWIAKTPNILGEELLIIAKEYVLPSGVRLDLLAIDKAANLVVIELKRDHSGSDVDWQAIKYVSYCSNFTQEEIHEIYADYLGSDEDEAKLNIEEFIEDEMEKVNDSQRIFLAAKEFHSDVVSAVLWLRDFGIDIQCIKLEPFLDDESQLFINPSIIMPLPEAKDYIKRKETKIKEKSISKKSSFSLEKSNYDNDTLKQYLVESFTRDTGLTPRVVLFFNILLSEERCFDREEIKEKFFQKGFGQNIGHTGRLLSNVSQFLTKKSNPHLRQVVNFKTSGGHGEMKNNYEIISKYREIVKDAIEIANQKKQ